MKNVYFVILSLVLALSNTFTYASSKEDLFQDNSSLTNRKRSNHNNMIQLNNKKDSKKAKKLTDQKIVIDRLRLEVFNAAVEAIKENKKKINYIDLRDLIINKKYPLKNPEGRKHPMYDILKSMKTVKNRSKYYHPNIRYIEKENSFIWEDNVNSQEMNHVNSNEKEKNDDDSSFGLSSEDEKNENDLSPLENNTDIITNIIPQITEIENNNIENKNINDSSNEIIIINIWEPETDNKEKITHDDFISISDSSLDSKKEKIILWNKEEIATELKNIQTLQSLRKMDLEDVKNEILNINNDIKNYNEIIVNLKKDKKKTKNEPEQKNIIKEKIKNTKKILSEFEIKLKNCEGFENTLSLNMGMQNNYKNSLENAEEKHKKLEKITRKIEELQDKKVSLSNNIKELGPDLSINKKQVTSSEKQISMYKKKIDMRDPKKIKIEIKKEN